MTNKTNIILTDDLRQAVVVIKAAIQRSQARALQGVNTEMLSLYYGIGHYVSEHSRVGKWGTGAITAISDQLQKEMPGLTGFSASNIRNMRQFYETWVDFVNRQPLAGELPVDETELLAEIRQPLADEMDWNDFVQVPFSHHVEILNKCATFDERAFYIHMCATRRWNKYALRDFIKEGLYQKRGNLPSNFTEVIPDTQLAVRTLKAFKGSYQLGFINAEDLYESPEERNEPMLNQKIVENIRDFILRFGQDFIFIAPQYRLQSGEDDKFIDLLFFNRHLNCLVAVELKDCRFEPAHLGQLSYYLTLLDKQTKQPHENPSVGLVLCREMDKTVVELAVQDYTKPMGVATFRLGQDEPEEYKGVLPNLSGLHELMQDVEDS